MSEEEKFPFFINTRRIQRADSYFDIGRTQERLRKLLVEKNNSHSVPLSCQNLEENASVGFYGVKRYISLEPDPDDENFFEKDFTEIDEDLQFENTSAFSLFWMTFKRIALSVGEHFSSSKLSRGIPNDPECNHVQETKNEELYKVLVDPSFRDSRITQNKIVYGDVNYLIQKFRMDLNCGSLDIALFSVEFPSSQQLGKIDSTDLQTYVISPECGSFIWVEDGKASAIFMTKSSTDFFGSVMEWFRKILSDMTLADSVMVGHPYYWHPSVRRRLTKVIKYLKRLYRTLALKERERHQKISQSETVNAESLAVICPTEISKIVINEQPSCNLAHTGSTYEKLNMMLEQLVKKWLEYQRNLEHSRSHTLKDISRTWTESSPQSLTRGITDGGNFLESVTFLDFHSDKRGICSSSNEDESGHKIPSSCQMSDNKNKNYSFTLKESKTAEKVPCIDTGQNIAQNITEGCHQCGKEFDEQDDAAKGNFSATASSTVTSTEMEDHTTGNYYWSSDISMKHK